MDNFKAGLFGLGVLIVIAAGLVFSWCLRQPNMPEPISEAAYDVILTQEAIDTIDFEACPEGVMAYIGINNEVFHQRAIRTQEGILHKMVPCEHVEMDK